MELRHIYIKACFLENKVLKLLLLRHIKGERILNFSCPHYYYEELYFSLRVVL